MVSGSGDGGGRGPNVRQYVLCLLINNFVNTQRANWTYPSNTLRPYRIEAEEGLMVFKLRCRKFVELILQAVGIDNEAKIACASGRQRQ